MDQQAQQHQHRLNESLRTCPNKVDIFRFVYNGVGIPIAAGALYPIASIRLSPIIAAAAMALSSLSVVTNANRLRRFTAPPLPATATPRSVEPHVETGQQHPTIEPASVTDPVCGMQIDPADAAATLVHQGRTYHFCSTGCRDAFTAEPERYTGGVDETQMHRT